MPVEQEAERERHASLWAQPTAYAGPVIPLPNDLDVVDANRYVSLTTFRRTGTPVATPGVDRP